MATEKTTTADGSESEATNPHEEGAFGLSAARLRIDPGAPIDELLFDTAAFIAAPRVLVLSGRQLF